MRSKACRCTFDGYVVIQRHAFAYVCPERERVSGLALVGPANIPELSELDSLLNLLCARWDPGRRWSSLEQALLCRDQDPFRKLSLLG